MVTGLLLKVRDKVVKIFLEKYTSEEKWRRTGKGKRLEHDPPPIPLIHKSPVAAIS